MDSICEPLPTTFITQASSNLLQKLLHSSHQFSAQYIDDFEELPFDLDTLRRHVERLIIVSAPVQTFITEIRDIYTWKSPGRTGLWLVSYFFLWYISHNMTFVVRVYPCQSLINTDLRQVRIRMLYHCDELLLPSVHQGPQSGYRTQR